MNETTLFINLKNLENNINLIKSLNLSKNKTIIAILKSDAYGHGIAQVARTLTNNGINFFGVIKMDEATVILKNHPAAKLLMLAGVYDRDLKQAFDLNLSIAAYDLDYLNLILSKARRFKKNAKIHIKYDSGMNRLGFNGEDLKKAMEIIKNNREWLEMEGVFSHLSSAGNDKEYTDFQLKNFKEILQEFKNCGIEPKYRHISASSALFNKKLDDDFSNAVRPGISLYGINPNLEGGKEIFLKPLMTLKSSIIQIKTIKKGAFVSYNNTFKAPRDMTAAIINAGYDNGLPRLLSNKGRVLIRDAFANIIGIVTMNTTIVDITEINGVTKNDEVIIIGAGNYSSISISELAHQAQTIPYEICLNLGKSNPRIYID